VFGLRGPATEKPDALGPGKSLIGRNRRRSTISAIRAAAAGGLTWDGDPEEFSPTRRLGSRYPHAVWGPEAKMSTTSWLTWPQSGRSGNLPGA
jgi:hypothetical protein